MTPPFIRCLSCIFSKFWTNSSFLIGTWENSVISISKSTKTYSSTPSSVTLIRGIGINFSTASLWVCSVCWFNHAISGFSFSWNASPRSLSSDNFWLTAAAISFTCAEVTVCAGVFWICWDTFSFINDVAFLIRAAFFSVFSICVSSYAFSNSLSGSVLKDNCV